VTPKGCLCPKCKHLDARITYGITDLECGKGWPCSCTDGRIPQECPGCPGFEPKESDE